MTRYPRAEQFARQMPLPLKACPVTRELYGYTKPILDQRAALGALGSARIHGEAREAAMAILEARAEQAAR